MPRQPRERQGGEEQDGDQEAGFGKGRDHLGFRSHDEAAVGAVAQAVVIAVE